MAKSVLFITIVITASLFLSAVSLQLQTTDAVLEKLYSKWNWLESTGGIPVVKSNPSTANYTEMIEFNKDGISKRYKNSQLEDSMKFLLTIDSSSDYRHKKIYWINHEGGRMRQSATFKGNDTLILEDEYGDGYTSTYARQK